MGITADGVKTSDLRFSSLFSPLSPTLNDVIQLEIEHGYDQFLTKVSEGRHLTKAQVDNIAQGQVWLGSEALEHKLVDELGTLDTAIGKTIELVNQKRAEKDKLDEASFSVEWIVDEDSSLLKKMLRDFKGDAKTWAQGFVLESVGLPKAFTQLTKPLGTLTRFNDPKGQYLYCLTCGSVK